MERKKGLWIILIGILVLCGCYFGIRYMDFDVLNTPFKQNGFLVLIVLVLLCVLLVFYMIHGRTKNKELKLRDKLFNSLVQNSDTIYLMYNRNTKQPIYITKNIERVLGVKESENKNALQALSDFFELPIVKNEIKNWDKESDLVSQMISYNNLDYQHTRWFKLKIYPMQEKKLEYAVVLISDVTKEHDQQHLLVTQASDIKMREQQLNQITATAYDVEVDVNVNSGTFRLRNLKKGMAYFGPERSGQYISEFERVVESLVDEADRNQLLSILSLDELMTMSQEKTPEPISVRFRLAKQNEVVWLESTAFFTVNKGEVFVTILTKNVTEDAEYMRKQNVLLQEALDDAKKANDAKSNFLATLSHEIRTPMNAILGLSESVLSEEMPRALREDVENINEASHSLLNVIDGILDISKIEEGKIQLEEKEYRVPTLFKNLAGMTKERIGSKNIDLEMVIDNDMPNKLFGDRGKIHQILLNILDNAVNFTESGSILFRVDCKKEKSIAHLTVSIKDTGCGISKKNVETLFDEEKKHEGMGLTITKKLIELLNGELTVESVEGKGSTFVVQFDQKILDDTPIGNMDLYQSRKKIAEAFNASGKSILVVDDDKLNLKVATRLLKPYGVNVEMVSSGKECIDAIKNKKHYDLILLDQMMPEMDGIETLHELKKIDDFEIPVIVLTADAIVGVKEKYLKEGFQDYLSKPIDTKELNQLLRKYLSN